MGDNNRRFPRWVKLLIAVVVALFLAYWFLGIGGSTDSALAAGSEHPVTLCNKSKTQCVNTTQEWIDRGKGDPTKVRTKTEHKAMASSSKDRDCDTVSKVREFPHFLFGFALARTRLTKSWCYNPKTGRITHVEKPSFAYAPTGAGSNTGWDGAGEDISETWIYRGNNRRWAHETIASAKFRRCFEAIIKLCLGSVRIITRITVYGDGRPTEVR